MRCALTFEVEPLAGTPVGGVRLPCEVIDHIKSWCREFRVTEPAIDSFFRQRCRR
jgi:hypothetical protein